MVESNSRVVLNVGGTRHMTNRATLKKIPATRLSKLTEAMANFDPVKNEYFFDRHPIVFSQILNYYRTGKLHYPRNYCGPLYEEELEFWGLDSNQVEPCCWMTYTAHKSTEETLLKLYEEDISMKCTPLTQLYREFHGDKVLPQNLTFWQKWRPLIWAAFEEQYSSWWSRVLMVTTVLCICLDCACLTVSSGVQHSLMKPWSPSHSLSLVANLWFTLEFVLRWTVAKKPAVFLLNSLLNVNDLVALLAFYTDFISWMWFPESHFSLWISSLEFLRFLRFIKLTKFIPEMRILSMTLRRSRKELLLWIFFLVVFIVEFGSGLYFLERFDVARDPNTPIVQSVATGLWWSMVTLLTVGYGDEIPKSVYAQFLGALCAVVGVLVVALPVPLIGSNFLLYYSHMQARMKLPKERRRVVIPVRKSENRQKMQHWNSLTGRIMLMNTMQNTPAGKMAMKENMA